MASVAGPGAWPGPFGPLVSPNRSLGPMSTRTYRTRNPNGTAVEVTAGSIDSERLYLVITRLRVEEDTALLHPVDEVGNDVVAEEKVLFCRWEREGGLMHPWEVTTTLAAHGLAYPTEWLEALVGDFTTPSGAVSDHGFLPQPTASPTSEILSDIRSTWSHE